MAVHEKEKLVVEPVAHPDAAGSGIELQPGREAEAAAERAGSHHSGRERPLEDEDAAVQ